jgi:DNA polymerase beta
MLKEKEKEKSVIEESKQVKAKAKTKKMKIQVIYQRLTEMKSLEKSNGEVFKARAYDRVLKSMTDVGIDMNTEVTDVAALKALGVSGIGKGIEGKIEEILETGKLAVVETNNDRMVVLKDLQRIHGIGPVKAKELVEEHDVTCVADLLKKENMALLTDAQKVGLKYVDDFEKRIPRKEMDKHNEFIKKIMTSSPKLLNASYEIAGSYRRGAKDSGDIDIILTSRDDKYEEVYEVFIQALKDNNYLTDDLAKGPTKYMGVARLPRHKTSRRVDIMVTSSNDYPFAVLYFTGSQAHNIKMRNVALELGYSLSEYGLRPLISLTSNAMASDSDGSDSEKKKKTKGKGKAKDKGSDQVVKVKKPLPRAGFKSEKDIFDFLGMEYVDPLKR